MAKRNKCKFEKMSIDSVITYNNDMLELFTLSFSIVKTKKKSIVPLLRRLTSARSGKRHKEGRRVARVEGSLTHYGPEQPRIQTYVLGHSLVGK